MTLPANYLPSFLQRRHYEVNGCAFHMILVKAGSFVMGGDSGYDDEKPAHEVHLTRDFEMGEFPVTQGLWQAVMGAEWPHTRFRSANRPAERVSWNDICQPGGFLERLNQQLGNSEMPFRLPTEAEWEYAARGGRYGRHFPYQFAGSERVSEVGWHWENSQSETQIPGRKLPNPLGLHDMGGNVLEWCADWYAAYPTGFQINPAGPETGSNRVIRGGSWYDAPALLRCASRSDYSPDLRNRYIGFRLARAAR